MVGPGRRSLLVTFCGKVHEVLAEELPKARSLACGLMSDLDFAVPTRSRIIADDIIHRMHRFQRGHVTAVRLMHDTADIDAARPRDESAKEGETRRPNEVGVMAATRRP